MEKGMYFIQIGRYKSAYKTRYATEKESQAYLLYKGLNIGYGYKKRLVLNGKTILRYIS